MSDFQPADPKLLAALVPISALRPERQRDLANQSKLIHAKAGDLLFRKAADSKAVIYVIEGQVEVSENGAVVLRIEGGTEAAKHGISPARQRQCEASCVTDAKLVAVDSRQLDVMLTWDQSDTLEVHDVASGDDSDDWMMRLLQTPAFQMIPPTNLQAIFMRMQKVQANAGDIIVQQGDAGDYFYVLTEGRCLVQREQAGQKPIRLAEFGAGACFGEEALISDAPRNATITMLTQGALMRLAKEDFQSLLNDPLSRRLSRMEADALVEGNRAQYLDVRLPSEFAKDAIPGSTNLPLYMLRMKLKQLDPGMSYVCVCDTGSRSSVASFVLLQKGFEAYALTGGLDSAASEG